MAAKKWEGGTRRTFVAALIVFTALMLALPESALTLPSEIPDNNPMVDGRVRAIEQVGTNVWLGGKFTQVKNATARSWAACPTWRSSTRRRTGSRT